MIERLAERTDPEVIVVDWSAWSGGESGTVLDTYHLRPCIGVAFYHGAMGYMGHFVNASTYDKPVFEQLLDKVRNSIADRTQLRVWARGGALSGDEDDASIEAHRAYVEGEIQALGMPRENVDIEWLEANDHWVNMRLDCSSGEFRSAKDILANKFRLQLLASDIS